MKAEVLVISDSNEQVKGVRFEPVFAVASKAKKLRRIPMMRRLVKEFRPDIVHGHYLNVGGLYASLSGGKIIVGSAWGSDIYYDPKRSLRNRFLLKWVLRKCALVFAGSKNAAEAVRGYGFKGEIPIVRFGVDQNKFLRTSRHGTNEFRILSPRHCSRIYNPKIIVEAFRRVLPKMPNAFLYLVESGNEIQEIHQMVESDKALASHVRFYPWKSYDQMPELYNSMDIAISIPDSDSVAASVMEAMASELPVIVSDIPNMRELVEHGVTGYITRIGISDLADRLSMVYAMRSMLPEIGKRARAKVLNPVFQATWESNMLVAEEAYEGLIRNRSGR